jgi:hypothetical protein
MRLVPVISIAGLIMITSLSGTANDKRSVQCEVLTQDAGDTINFVGRVQSSTKLTGTYELVVKKQGGAGTSEITQSGAFEARPDKFADTSSAQVGKDDKARYDVRLLVKWSGGQQECHWDGTSSQIKADAPPVTASRQGNRSVTRQEGRGNKATTLQKGAGNSSTIIQIN